MSVRGFLEFLTLVAMLFAACAHVLHAQPANDEFIRQQERERQLRLQQEPSPDARIPRPDLPDEYRQVPSDESPCFVISDIVLEGDEVALFRYGLDPVLTGADAVLHRCIGTRGINVVLARVQHAIIDRGYVTTRVLVPPQDLSKGTLKLTVIPGRVREIRFVSGQRLPHAQENALALGEGDILNLRKIEQSLENMKRVPSADVSIQIAPTSAADAAPGESDLLIEYSQGFPLRLTLTADDGGSKSTGKYQGSATISYDNALGINDLFYVSTHRDLGGGEPGERGSKGHSAHYSFPIGVWLVSTNYSHHRYHQAVAGVNQTYRYSGRSQTQDTKLTRLIYRNAVSKTFASLHGFLRSSKNYIDDTEIEVQRRRTAGWIVSLDHRHFIGATVLDAGFAFRRGTGALDAMPSPEEQFGEGTARMKILNFDVNWRTPFEVQAPWGNQRMRYSANVRGQRNYTPLSPQDRFSIGSRYTVRGFDGELTLAAERGWLFRNDLAFLLSQSDHEIYVGVDYGRVGGQSARLLPGTALSGAVMGLRGQMGRLGYDLFAGTPLHKPHGFDTSNQVAGFSLIWSY